MRYLLSAATIALSSGLGVGAAHAQNLGDAVRSALGNGCQGFLSPNEFSTTDLIQNIGAETLGPYRAFQYEPISIPPDPNDPPVPLLTELNVPDSWKEPGVIVVVRDDDGSVTGFNLLFDGSPDEPADSRFLRFTSVDGTTYPDPSIVNFVQLQATATQLVNVSEVRTPNAGLLGPGLARYCSVTGVASEEALTRLVFSNFFFNDQGGLKPGQGSPGLFGSANALTAFSSAFGAGAGANRSQESVVRRERGLASLIERLRRRAERWREAGMQVASLDDTILPQQRNFAIVLDASGGFVNLDRDATQLEGAFSADSVVANFGAALAFRNNFILGGSLAFENTDSSVQASPAGQTDFENETFTGSAFVGWTSGPASFGFENPATVTLTAAASLGNGDQSYHRGFEVTYQPDLNDAATPTATDSLAGSVDQDYTSFSLQAGAMQPLGGAFTFTPHVSITYVKFESGSYSETVSDGADDGLSLRYADVEDEWIEGRIGAGLSYEMALRNDNALEIGFNVDAVFIGDAETPLRTAYFAQDLRANPYAITYQVDDLDDQYFDLSGSVGVELANGLTPYISAFTRVGHDYLKSDGLFLGVRYAF